MLLDVLIDWSARHVAVWNLIGAIGFTLCGALGYAALSSTKVRSSSIELQHLGVRLNWYCGR